MRDTEVLVVGGGATGLGAARDLARRGVDVTLVERGSLAEGTTGRTHGVLHSGARYADDDPESARACIAENRVLREIAPHCVEDTGGLFVALADNAYVGAKRAACEACGIPVAELDGDAARQREPALAEGVERALAVPDAVVDPPTLCAATAADAAAHGARIETETAVSDLHVDGGQVTGATLDRAGETVRLRAAHVVVAAGPWSARVAALAGVDVPVATTQGAMAVLDCPTRTVVNRCRPRAHGDIAVPTGERTVLGTTEERIEGPEAVRRDRERATALLREEASAVLPDVADARRVGTYWGVRPLYAPEADDPTAASRTFGLVDGRAQGVAGFSAVVGGKLTTHRLMAERTADRVCARLDVSRSCSTADAALPGAYDESALDERLGEFGLAGTWPPSR